MAKHHSAQQWRLWFLKFEQIELTVADFCKSVGVSVQSYYKWRKKLKLLDGDGSTLEAKSSNFVAVSLAAAKIEIEFPGGAIARISNDADSLRPLVGVLLEQGAVQ